MKLWKLVAFTLLMDVIQLVAMPAGAVGISTKYSTTIYVVEPGRIRRHNTCFSFECISDSLRDSTEVLFNVSHMQLMIPLIKENLINIALRGNGHTTRVSCSAASGNGNSGVQIINATNFMMENIEFVNCESTYTYLTMEKHTGTLIAAVQILHSVNCTIKNVVFSNSSGRGLIFSETRGMVFVRNCKFKSNRFIENKDIHPRGGGVFILFNSTENSKTTYNFSYCSFMHNDARDDTNPYGEGGGMLVNFREASANISIHVIESFFINNSANWGGAIHVIFKDQSNHNRLTIENTTFISNKAPERVGGAIDIGYRFTVNSSEVPHDNTGLFYNCTFKNNSAAYGGGVSMFSSKAFHMHNRKDSFVFRKCTWDGNKGEYGSAVDLSPEVQSTLSDGWIPLLPVFEDCIFVNSELSLKTPYAAKQDLWKQYRTGRGTFLVTSFNVLLSGKLIFENNTFSAMCLVDSMVDFGAATEATFNANSGYNGGAVAMYGFSALRVGENSKFIFQDNTAKRNGGAIFYKSIDHHDFISTRSCFIQNRGFQPMSNVTFEFYNNVALNGPSIFASSILPCYYFCNVKDYNSLSTSSEIFDCIATFEFDSDEGVSTLGWRIEVNQTQPLQVIPGVKTDLPIKLKDELNNTINGVYYAKVVGSTTTIKIDKAHSYIHYDQMEIYGKPHDIGKIELSTMTDREVVLTIEVEMLQCPPGFVIELKKGSDEQLYHCVCSANTNQQYLGIWRCNMSTHQAYIQRHYWAGYIEQSENKSLLIGGCASNGQCRLHRDAEYLLPNTTSMEELDEHVCAPNRRGILCSTCKEGYSVHFHSPDTTCYKNSHCHLGWLLYILSELVPLTALFMVVMIFNVNFTSGSTNAFILFAQTFQLDLITAHRSVWVDERIYFLLRKLHFIYRFFSLELFTLSKLSFCLWNGSQTLDIVAFKYVTIVYGLSLIALTVVIMNICNIYRLFHVVSSPSKVRGYMVHGLTTFLVLCYSECTKVTLEILTPAALCGAESSNQEAVVVRQYGDIEFFSRAHLLYAIPALVCLFIIILPPPLFLLIYPVHYKLFHLLRINDTKFARLISLGKLKPLFDSFQGCYRDKYRFFAGLYFLFRLLSGLRLAITVEPHDGFPTMQILLAVLIVLIVACRPYQKNWHNIVDSVIFLNLLIISILTMYNFTTVQSYSRRYAYKTVHVIQTVMSFLPLIYMVFYLGVKIISFIYKRRVTKATEMNIIPARLDAKSDSDDSDEESSHYCQYSEATM